MSAARTPTAYRGFLGNGAWLVFIHTKKCSRHRRNVTPSKRAYALIPNQLDQFLVATRARAAINKATGAAA